MQRIALIARLKPGAEQAAAELIGSGPPFDPAALGLERHEVYLSAGEVVFVFEGTEVEWAIDDVVTASQPPAAVQAALAAWRELVDGHPRIARPAYHWQSSGA